MMVFAPTQRQQGRRIPISRVAKAPASERYWQRVRLDRLGRVQVQPLEAAQAFLADSLGDGADLDWQRWLVSQWRDRGQDMAATCLECFISHQLRDVCQDLAQRFGRERDFSREELLPFVLLEEPGDDGAPPLLQRIRDSFDPARGSLSTWAVRLVKSDPGVRRFLLDRGLEQVTDWLILNRTNPGRLERVLRSLNATQAERQRAQHLLAAYHQCYRDPLVRQRAPGTRSRYPNPSEEQLQRIAQHWLPSQPPAPPQVLAELQQLAGYIRADRIRARGGAVPSWQLPETLAGGDPEPEPTEGSVFLEAYREQFDACLAQSIAQTVENRVAFFQHGKTTSKARQKAAQKAQQFLEALRAFHCQGTPMAAIAVDLGLKDQPRVSRLLDLKGLRADIARNTLSRLQQQVLELARAYVSAERLRELDAQVQTVLAEEVETAIAAAQKEASTGYNRAMTSPLARAICDYLDRRRQA